MIALLGTGLMGAPMARNLIKAAYDVTVWNRTPEKAEALASDGATVAKTAAEAVKGANTVVTMLADGPTVNAVMDDVMDALEEDALWIDMSSAKPGEARAQAERLAERGMMHLDAPVSGGTKGAEAASLAIMAGGTEEAFKRGKPVLGAMGNPVHVGPTGAGQLAKLANQTIVAVTIGAVAEAMLLLEKGGADPAAVRQALKGGFADSTILQQHGERMTERNFVPGGLTKFQVKDLNNALAEAEGAGLTLPMTTGVRDRFQRLIDEMDGADMDHSALFVELLDRNGLREG